MGEQTKVEQVAAALKKAMPGLDNPEAWPWKTLACAAIEAMREPIDAMLAAGGTVEIERPGNDETNSTYDLWPEEVEKVWRLMIDTALAEDAGAEKVA